MKVIHVNAVIGTGSTGRIVSELASGLSERGVTAQVAFSLGDGRPGDYRIGNVLEHKAHALASRVSGRQAYFSTRGTRGLLAYLREQEPDVVHLHNLHANYVNLPMLLQYLSMRDIPTVLTLHDCWFFTGKCCHYTLDQCSRWTSGCGSCPRLKKDNPSWFFDRTAEAWRDKKTLLGQIPRLGVIGVSDWITAEAERSMLMKASLLERIYNWVDTDVFKPGGDSDGLGISHRDPQFTILGVASRWDGSKGIDDFLRLGELIDQGILNSHTSTRTVRDVPRIVLVGELGQRVSLPQSVTLLGPVESQSELASIYSSASVLLQLSCEETFGKVTAESLACGTPAIVYDSTANAELIGSGCGYAVAAGDLDLVISRLREMQSAGVSAYQDACRGEALSRFKKDDRIDDHIAMYETLRGLNVSV